MAEFSDLPRADVINAANFISFQFEKYTGRGREKGGRQTGDGGKMREREKEGERKKNRERQRKEWGKMTLMRAREKERRREGRFKSEKKRNREIIQERKIE